MAQRSFGRRNTGRGTNCEFATTAPMTNSSVHSGLDWRDIFRVDGALKNSRRQMRPEAAAFRAVPRKTGHPH